MSRIKFAADKIGKQFIPGRNEEEDYSESDYSDENEEEREQEFNPSRLRADAIPTDGEYKGQKITRAELEKLQDEYDDEEEDEFDDDDDDIPDFDSDNIPIPAPEGADDLEDELAQLEKDEGESLVDSLRQQQEADLRVAQGTKSLGTQYSALMLLRLKLQKVLSAINQLPPSILPESTASPFHIAAQDPEVAALLHELNQSASKLFTEIHEIKSTLEKYYEWNEPDSIAENMMEIIAHWGQRLRLSSGMKRGSVINRPIEQQIESALDNRELLIQPSRHRDPNENVFGVDEQPEVMNEIYNDYNWYKRIVADSIGASSSQATTSSDKVKVSKPQKQMIKSKQINYDVIPEIQHFMTPTMAKIPDYVDALFSSLMK